jgi:hypothetical protein
MAFLYPMGETMVKPPAAGRVGAVLICAENLW